MSARRPPYARSLAALGLAASLVPGTAGAIPFGRRLSLRAETMAGASVGQPNADRYPFGFVASARLGVMLFEPVSLQLSVTQGIFPSSVTDTSLLNTYSGGVRVEPRTVAPEGRIFVEGNAGFVRTGFRDRFGFDIGIGWELALSRVVYLGPVLRYGHIVQPDDVPFAEDQDAHYLMAGVSLMLRPFPPPPLRQGSLVAINPFGGPDRDYDGVPDALDGCPTVVEDHDGFDDDDGCPDLDDDRDGNPDVEDRCPRAPETRNDFEDDDGCPDRPPAQEAPVEFRGDQIRLRQRVYFEVERVIVPPTAFRILQQLALFLAAHPEIRTLRVEGHADDRGTARHGFELSFRRAQNVVDFLVNNGVERGRLQPVGYGSLRPLDTAHDEVTRAGNRRIEFVIADGPAGQAPAPPEGAWLRRPDAITDPTSAPPAPVVPGPSVPGPAPAVPAPR